MVFLFDLPTFQVGRNICHGSDAVESANKEIALWLAIDHTFRLNNYQRTYSIYFFRFKPEELCDWNSTQKDWIYE